MSSSLRASTVGGCWCDWTGVADRDAADGVARQSSSSSTPEDLPPIDDPDEFYDHQLEGLRVVTTDGRLVGNVDEVLHTAAGGAVVGDDRRRAPKYWCRSSARSSPRCRWQNQTIEIDPPDGLLELG